MTVKRVSLFLRLLRGQEGQTLVYVSFLMIVMLGMGGFLIDLGRFYVVRTQLQNSTNASGLAAAGSVYNAASVGSASDVAMNFAANNPTSGLPENHGYPIVVTPCLNVLMPDNKGCINDSTGNASPIETANAIRITEQVSMPTYFMKLFGVKSLTTQATATASMQGAAQPWNVAFIVDSTPSMNSADSSCGLSEFDCAEQGIQDMLSAINPCKSGTSCASTSNSVFRVSLFSFPNVDASTVAADYCAGGTAQATVYSLPVPTNTAVNPSGTAYTGNQYGQTTYTTKKGVTTPHTTTFTATYQITPPNTGGGDANGFYSDYFNNGQLNPSSLFVKAIGNGSTKGCLQSPAYNTSLNNLGTGTGSGGITYFASVIYAAEMALANEQAAFPGSKNAIIFLGDGQASLYTAGNDFPNGLTPQAMPDPDPANLYDIAEPATVWNQSGANKGFYPSSYDQCQQAIIASEYAQAAGTRVYGIAYGAEQAGCYSKTSSPVFNATDATLTATGSNLWGQTLNDPFSINQLTPCITIENIASPNYFYSDWQASGNQKATGCVDDAHLVSTLKGIFGAIGATFTQPRLLTNNAN